MTALYTVGHSSRTIDAFLALLRDAGVRLLVDVRAHPASRRFPHFSRAALAASLDAEGIDYEWAGDALGGLRRARADSPHRALDAGFRGFADHMASAAFATAVGSLIERARTRKVAIMCAEQEPADCHRSLISDALLVRGVGVEHLIGPGVRVAASFRPEARIAEGQLIYDAGSQRTLL